MPLLNNQDLIQYFSFFPHGIWTTAAFLSQPPIYTLLITGLGLFHQGLSILHSRPTSSLVLIFQPWALILVYLTPDKLARSFYAPSNMFEVQEFCRLRASLKAKQEHASLLQDFREFDWAIVDVEENGGFEGQALLKEQDVGSSTGQMDTVISQAHATVGALVLQRSTFSDVNHILSAIERKKSMDTISLSLVASLCTFLILLYWLTK